VDEQRQKRLESALDDVGWGLLLIGLAALALNGPAEAVAIAAVGGAFLLLNGARIRLGVPIRWFSTVLGAACLSGGLVALTTGVRVELFAIFFLLAGAVTVSSALLRLSRSPSAA
jgi:hypothetical protein